jgi:hypothetical protein
MIFVFALTQTANSFFRNYMTSTGVVTTGRKRKRRQGVVRTSSFEEEMKRILLRDSKRSRRAVQMIEALTKALIGEQAVADAAETETDADGSSAAEDASVSSAPSDADDGDDDDDDDGASIELLGL